MFTLAVSLSGCTSEQAGGPSPARSNGIIAYADFFAGIVFINTGGTPADLSQGQLSGEDRYSSLAWSPDGRQLAFVQDAPMHQGGSIGVFNVATGAVNELTSGSSDSMPTWSPGGDRIAFARFTEGSVELCVMGADGSDVQVLRPVDPKVLWAPPPVDLSNYPQPTAVQPNDVTHLITWSPDSKVIAFGTDPFGKPIIEVVSPTDGHITATFEGRFPAWGPTGNRVAFSRQTGERTEALFVVDASGADVKEITNGTSIDVFPSWSPDGQLLAYASDAGGRPGDLEIWTIRPDGSGAKRLTTKATEYASSLAIAPAWSPDGTELLYLDEIFRGAVDLWVGVVDVDGSNQRTLTHVESRSPAWQPLAGSLAS